jgi:DNA-binding CsgD family transcriptional regulator
MTWWTSLSLAVRPLRIRGMARPLPRTQAPRSLPKHVAYQLTSKADVLAKLAELISTQWDGLEHQARLALVRRIQHLALEMGQLAERSSPGSGRATFDDDAPWFHGLIFLTPRENEVLRAMSLGASTRRMQELFGISAATVRSHVKNILAKLGVHSRVEAVSVLLTWDIQRQQPA